MRRALCVVPVLLCLLGLALPAWGKAPATSDVLSSLAGSICPASSTPGSTGLPDLIPTPLFKTGQCGDCSGACSGHNLLDSCSTETGIGQCFGLRDGNVILFCPGTTLYQCACIGFD